jgi:hypothetical protein
MFSSCLVLVTGIQSTRVCAAGRVFSIPKTGDDWIPVTGTGKREVVVGVEVKQ